ncbi:MAG: PilZ domain-containing protein [Proteobacteria bacterium]|nr:PilZ domain-containing protein [Pseudomonadota bacterium]
MAYKERKDDRIHSLNLLSYTCLDHANNELSRGMGRTLDISENGILLETHVEIIENTNISISIGLKDEVIDIMGTVIYTRKEKDGKYQAGIEFKETDERAKQILNKYILLLK